MVVVPRIPLTKLLASNTATLNTCRVIAFDPGAAATGWAVFQLDYRAFTRPEHKVLANMYGWDCGEFTGPEVDHYNHASTLVYRAHFTPMPFNYTLDVVSEDFELTQLIGGRNLLSPVRFNAVIDWECRKHGLSLQLQARQLRTSITKPRLAEFGFCGRFKKDEFSAMQHGITWLRRVKQKANQRPWKLADKGHTNDYYDCACHNGYACDLRHPT